MFQLGPFNISLLELDRFRLDGGAMFGSVPKSLWARRIAADDNNRIQLTCRVMVIETQVEAQNRKFLVDVGMGRKWSEKERAIYEIEHLATKPLHELVSDVTGVILTHMHFDHAGGVSYRDRDGLHLSFPNAVHFLSERNWSHAQHPGVRERASYLKDNIEPLKDAKLVLTNDGEEVLPGISLHRSEGHTHGLQMVKVSGVTPSGTATLFYPADLIPTAHHISTPYVMGYDLCAETSMSEKERYLTQAVAENWILVFEHDADTPACRVGQDEKGNFVAIPL